ncbi:acetolactate synthase large subunit domain protein (plasmid) [Haloferax gibbonsii]|uniref:Acetolactate synthase large subunit domain protein n=2 Tax=Haloferax gibbonsii TaxID=35746 RepID=A0A871BM55_HALGI|nr:acetolactate synthase large subunit domain protein [Haloferax gibbonsii]
MSQKRGSEAVIDYLEQASIDQIFFGPIGHTNFELWHALEETDSPIRPIEARNEFVAGYMAAGYAKASGEPAVLSAHTTPGLGNMVAPMASAYVNATPVVNISSTPPAKWWGRSPHHEIPPYSETHEIYAPITKAKWKVNDPGRVFEVLSNAFSQAVTGKPGPTLVALAADLLGEYDEYGEIPAYSTHVPQTRSIAEPDAVADALEALVDAEKPVILAGGGAKISRAQDSIANVAERLSIPVATTDSGKGVFPETHELSVGVVGAAGSRVANRIVADADLVFAIGTRFKELTTAAWNDKEIFSFPPQRLIQLDINGAEIGKYYPVAVALVGDADGTLCALASILDERDLSRSTCPQRARIDDLKSDWQAEFHALVDHDNAQVQVVDIVSSLQDILGPDAILTGGSGRNKSVPAQLYNVHNPESLLLDTGVGTMGASPGYAIGAQIAHPDRDVVCIEGDGGMHLSASAFATAREYDLPITFVIFNDSAYTGIASLQKAYVGESMGTEFDIDSKRYDVDFSKMAEAYGVSSTQVTESEKLHSALETAIAHDGPYVVDVILPRESPSPNPGVDWGLPGRGSGTWER